jgi:methionyl-tRNA formyltransferase
MKIVFFGTPEFAVPILKTLIEDKNIEVLALITQPDKPVGRKKIMTAPPCKQLALNYSIEVMQPVKLSAAEDVFKRLTELEPDFIITAAYGQIIKQNIIDLPKKAIINLHGSLLPAYRGPAPINWMIINGEHELGFCTMISDAGVDTGAVLEKKTLKINQDETAAELSERMSKAAATLMKSTLKNFDDITPQVQSTYEKLALKQKLAPFMNRELGTVRLIDEKIHYSSANPKQTWYSHKAFASAENLYNLYRGTFPWPGFHIMAQGVKITIVSMKLSDTEVNYEQAGRILKLNKESESIIITCYQGALEIFRLKPAGKSEMSAYAYVNGLRLKIGDKFA